MVPPNLLKMVHFFVPPVHPQFTSELPTFFEKFVEKIFFSSFACAERSRLYTSYDAVSTSLSLSADSRSHLAHRRHDATENSSGWRCIPEYHVLSPYWYDSPNRPIYSAREPSQQGLSCLLGLQGFDHSESFANRDVPTLRG
jgi:hypothetical protein